MRVTLQECTNVATICCLWVTVFPRSFFRNCVRISSTLTRPVTSGKAIQLRRSSVASKTESAR